MILNDHQIELLAAGIYPENVFPNVATDSAILPLRRGFKKGYKEGYSSRDREVSDLRGQIKYLEEDKHPKEIKELVDQLRRMCMLYGDELESHTSFQREQSGDHRHSQELISKYTKS